MELLILFAFLAGVVTIVSPCVLPVLPILLSTSTGGGRFRPVGIVFGLAITFAVVTLAVTAAAQALAIPATWLRIASIVLLGFFGLTLLIPTLGDKVERFLSPLTRLANTNGRASGFGGGLVIGAGLGFLWAPCVGPIMASVIGLTAIAGLTPQAAFITLAYSLGAALPMLILAYAGRGLASRARKLGPHTNRIKQAFGALTVVACLALFLGADTALQTFTLNNLPSGYSSFLQSFERGNTVEAELDRLQSDAEGATGTTAANVPQPESIPPTATPEPGIPLQDLGQAPELTGITQWWNSEPLTLAGLRGKVVIIDFWTYGCYNCVNTQPYVRALYDKYHDQGLEIIGVHTPELSFEYVPENVAKGIVDQKVTWPVAFDPDYKTWRSFDNHYWPAFYFLDATGRIRYTHFGEGNYENNEKVVQQLLAEAKSVSSTAQQPQPAATSTPQPQPTSTQEPTMTATPKPGLALKDMGVAPELTGTGDWVNSAPLKLADLRGKVVIVNFWTFGCYNCVNTLPYVKDLYAKYHDQGLEIVGVHTPEFSYEHILSNVQSHSKDLGVSWPVVQDNDYKTWRAYNNRYWPAFYFLDANGHIRYTHFGEGNYETNEKVVQQLLEEAKLSQ